MKKLILGSFAAFIALSASAQTPWLHVYDKQQKAVRQQDMTNVSEITFDETSGTMTICNADGSSKDINMAQMENFAIGPNVPRIDIVTDMQTYDWEALDFEDDFLKYDGLAVTEIVSKKYYLTGTLTFDGRGLYDDLEVPVKIRGRGNSTWNYDKKPYRLKFEEKQKLGPLHKAKNLCLLANHIDPSMMRNFSAFAFGKVIGMPYINRSLPVDVYLNGVYKGAYQLTEKTGINNGSIDLPKAIEANTVLFDIDTNNFDYRGEPAEDYAFQVPVEYPDDYEYAYYFKTPSLPARIKEPDAPEDAVEAAKWESYWTDDFYNFVDVVMERNPTKTFKVCDLDTLVRYMMVYDLTCNQELNHPKSVFVHKTMGGKYLFAPAWDFDWAFGYRPTYCRGVERYPWSSGYDVARYPSYQNPLLAYGSSDNQGGNILFLALIQNQTFLKRFGELWKDFYDNKQDEFWAAFDQYADQLRPSAALQATTRNSYVEFDKNVEELRQWIQNRIEFINSDPNYALWE